MFGAVSCSSGRRMRILGRMLTAEMKSRMVEFVKSCEFLERDLWNLELNPCDRLFSKE